MIHSEEAIHGVAPGQFCVVYDEIIIAAMVRVRLLYKYNKVELLFSVIR